MEPSTIFSETEIKELMQKSDWLGLLEVTKIWAWIVFAFALVAIYPNLLTIIIALFILGGKQLACAIVMHDTAHHSLFKTRSFNKHIGNWLGAYPIWHNVEQYMPYHLLHHRTNGTAEDPDLKLALAYPVPLKSFVRKIMRDLSGVSGIKAQVGVVMMHLGYLKYNLAGVVEKIKGSDKSFIKRLSNAWQHLRGPILFNLILFGILYLVGYPMLYLLWVTALLTTYNFCIRIRSMSEHSMTPDLSDPVKNVRTTYANFLERMLFAPLYVNYHAEHHLLMGVPAYKYPKMHQMLLERGYYKEAILANGYWDLVKRAASFS